MSKLMKYVLHLIAVIINYLSSTQSKKIKETQHPHQLERNSLCYCKNGKKYKNCHLKIDEKEGLVAIKIPENEIQLIKRGEYDQLKGVTNQNPKIKNTYSNIEAVGSSLTN